MAQGSDNALYPLLDFVTDDLPSSTKAPEMDDTNTRDSLVKDIKFTGVDASAGRGMGLEEMGTTLSFLVEVGYLSPPTMRGIALPRLSMATDIKQKFTRIGGRGATVK